MDEVEELRASNLELRDLLLAAEEKALRCEAEASEMYELANSQLQKNLDIASERISQLERENGTLALSLEVLRANVLGKDLVDTFIHARTPKDERLPTSPLKSANEVQQQQQQQKDLGQDDEDEKS